jgi:hypothetical protein
MKFKEFLELNGLDAGKKSDREKIEKAILELKAKMENKKDKISLLVAKADKIKQEYSVFENFFKALQAKLVAEESKKTKEKAEKK